jgi:peptidyl-tRNA hydrolase, PTH1 family
MKPVVGPEGPGRRWLVVGLGNPGPQYGDTRHNIGFRVVDRLAQEFAITVDRRKFDTLFGRGRVEAVEVALAKPLAYMNRSGPPVRQLSDFFKISTREILIIHDDIDLAFGRLKLKEKGGHGGHNGLRSVIDALGGGSSPACALASGAPVPDRMWQPTCWIGLIRMRRRCCLRSSNGPGMPSSPFSWKGRRRV